MLTSGTSLHRYVAWLAGTLCSDIQVKREDKCFTFPPSATKNSSREPSGTLGRPFLPFLLRTSKLLAETVKELGEAEEAAARGGGGEPLMRRAGAGPSEQMEEGS